MTRSTEGSVFLVGVGTLMGCILYTGFGGLGLSCVDFREAGARASGLEQVVPIDSAET